jgi:predicted DCC family thiol-disulfide oxidoreductase YuxK
MTARKVYFNSACPVCNAGVDRQRKAMAENAPACEIEWRDINKEPEVLAARGVSIDDVRRKLYVEDDQGRLHVGAAAFAALWQETSGQRWAGRLLRLPVVALFARWAYNGFASVLYTWNRRRGRW